MLPEVPRSSAPEPAQKRPRSGRSILQKPNGLPARTRVAILASVSGTSDKVISTRTTRSAAPLTAMEEAAVEEARVTHSPARVDSPADRISEPLDTLRTTASGTLPAGTTSRGVDTGAMPQTTEDQAVWDGSVMPISTGRDTDTMSIAVVAMTTEQSGDLSSTGVGTAMRATEPRLSLSRKRKLHRTRGHGVKNSLTHWFDDKCNNNSERRDHETSERAGLSSSAN